MGRRGNPPPRRQSTLSLAVLHRRIESCKISHLSSDDIAEHLYSTFPDYKHFKLIPFRAKVRQFLQSSRRNPREEEEESESDEGRSPSRKKQRQVEEEEREKKLVRREKDHMVMQSKRREKESSQDSTSSDEVSTSEDAVFGEDVKPEFDVMKSMLRAGYGDVKSTPLKSKANVEERNVEVEDVRREKKVLRVRGEKSVSEVVEDREWKGEGVGPRFKDLGGMKKVLEELMMEVLVPLYHPQVPKWLGVKPVSGVLIHGPPGCGKTQLARAIAKETGRPFYQISATEVVSGVSGTNLTFIVFT